MFPLRQRKDGGYNFGESTFYGSKHTGQDYVARYVDYFAPFDGMATKGKTVGGGNYWQLIRDNGDTFTARHLDKIYKTGAVKEGDLVALTGNTGAYTTGAHLHQEVKVNGKLVNPETYNWSSIRYPMNLKIQLVFNNQQYANEVGLLGQAKARIEALSGGKVTFNFLMPIYTTHSNIPSKVYMDTSGNFDQAVDKDWFIDQIWSLSKDADVVVLVGKPGDWQNTANGLITYGHYYSELPATFPALIQMVAGEADNSWKWPELNAFVHYLTHEVSHPLQQMSGTDRTHEFDYASVDGLNQILPNLNYENINYQLTHKVSYERNSAVFVRSANDQTIYLNEADVLVPFSASYENFLADFPNAKVIILAPDEFLKFKIADKVIIKDR